MLLDQYYTDNPLDFNVDWRLHESKSLTLIIVDTFILRYTLFNTNGDIVSVIDNSFVHLKFDYRYKVVTV